MLADAPVTAVLPVQDLMRATDFYRDRLGLADGGDAPDGHLMRMSTGTTIQLMSAEPGAQSSHTVLSFEVQDIETRIRELEQLGVGFEDYDLPGLRTENHICVMGADKAAWFMDPEGNVLCLHEHTSA